MFSGNSNETINSTLVDVTIKNPETEKAYCLVKLKNNADFFSVFNYVSKLEGVKESLATKGEAEIILILEKTRDEFSFADLEVKLIPAGGVAEVSLLKTAEQYSASKETEAAKVSSLLIMLVDDAKIDVIAKELMQNKYVNVCYAVKGKYNLLAELSSGSFAETDKYISNFVVAVPGVLKVKELPIINLYE